MSKLILLICTMALVAMCTLTWLGDQVHTMVCDTNAAMDTTTTTMQEDC